MGGPQILGSNHHRLGYSNARAMRAAFESDERYEVLGFFDFCHGDARLLAALRKARWAEFARIYNGPGQVEEYVRHVERAFLEARALLGQAQQTPGHERWEPTQMLELTDVGANGNQAAEAAELVSPTATAVAVAEAEPDPLVRVQHCPLDAYAYDRTGAVCSDGPQPGTTALRRLLRARFGERLAEIYNCRPIRGGTSLSLHAEGRAVDYYVNANDPQELQVGDQIVRWLLDPDDAGNSHAVARRLGVQEVIWNRRIWTAGRRRDDGMRPYSGVDPHTNHLHVGQNRAGAAMQTTYWAGC
jgi:hypothetical protein